MRQLTPLPSRRTESEVTMEIFIDSANVREIGKWLRMGVINGVTTNPSIMFKDGVYDAEAGAKEIAALVNPRPVS